jgi:hypothetical protein
MTAAGLVVLDSVQDRDFSSRSDHGQHLREGLRAWRTVMAMANCVVKACSGD